MVKETELIGFKQEYIRFKEEYESEIEYAKRMISFYHKKNCSGKYSISFYDYIDFYSRICAHLEEVYKWE